MSRPSPHSGNRDVSKALVDNAELLDALLDGPRQKPTLAENLDVSPETVYRKARKLDELGLLERSSEGYQLTQVGRLHAQMVNDVRSYSEKIYACERLFREIPNEKVPQYTVLRDADVVYGEPVAPNQLVERVETFIDEKEHLKIHMPVVLPRYMNVLRDHCSAENATLDLLLSDNVTEHVRQEYSDDLNRLLERERFAIRRSDEELPYSLLISNRPSPEVLLVAYGRMNGLHGILRNDTAVSVEWARETYLSYWESATVIRNP